MLKSALVANRSGGSRKAGNRKMSIPGRPLISVITVVYNCATPLSATIRSIAGQSYDNVEYIIIDGGSSDGTLDVIRDHAAEIDFWQSEPDNGVYDAMNKGIEEASGDWLLFLGAGDILLDCLHEVATRLLDPATVYYGDVYRPSRHIIYDGRFTPHKLSRRNFPHQAVFYPKQIFNHYSFDLRYPIMADYVFNIRAYCDKKFPFCYIMLLVTIYEDREGLSSRNRDAAFDHDNYQILRNNFGVLIGYEYLIREFFRRFERNVLRKAVHFLCGKQRRKGTVR